VNLTIFVPGNPVPQGSKSAFIVGKRAIIVEGRNVRRKDGTFSDGRERFKAWRKTVAAYAAAEARRGDLTPATGAVAVALTFWLPRPKSLPKRAFYAVKKPDCDKLARAVVDSLTGIAYVDDSQIVSLRVTKVYECLDRLPGVSITVRHAGAHDILDP
jgi:crossover junction endodeoxyribonuclease RusA